MFIFNDSCFVYTPQSHPDIKWVENTKTLFKVRIHVASTIYAQVQQVYYFSLSTDVDLQQGCPHPVLKNRVFEKMLPWQERKGSVSICSPWGLDLDTLDIQQLPGLMTQSVSFHDVMSLQQDLYLHKFFQHCQLMTSEGNPAELIRYLKVIYFIVVHLDQRWAIPVPPGPDWSRVFYPTGGQHFQLRFLFPWWKQVLPGRTRNLAWVWNWSPRVANRWFRHIRLFHLSTQILSATTLFYCACIIEFSPPLVPSCNRDSHGHQLPANSTHATVWSAHNSNQRCPRNCC